MRTWRVTQPIHWPDYEAIYAGDGVDKVKSAAYQAAKNAGYKISFLDFRAKRTPEFDHLAHHPAWIRGVTKSPICLGWRIGKDASGCLAKSKEE